MCIDFRDFNKERPKDDFPLSHMGILVDNIVVHTLPSFMDGYVR